MCTHENKKLVDWSMQCGMFGGAMHFSTYKCMDCEEVVYEIDSPFIYDYPPKYYSHEGNMINTQDYEIIKKKFEEVNVNKANGIMR
jgi:hypothetical protein